jgi:SAM-dependent methyltransferase
VHRAAIDSLPFEDDSLDFAYSLGVLHHVPDTTSALRACVRKLKTGAPFLLYLYYAFDNRPLWYRALWRLSDVLRRLTATLPPRARDLSCDAVALCVYWPLARAARLALRAGMDVSQFPLSIFRDRDLYTMRTDARDRFGTPLEKRFRTDQIETMMTEAGLSEIRFSESAPYWCALGFKSGRRSP